MIQRIQTLYLLLAAAFCVACLCLPIGNFVDAAGEECGTLYNLWLHLPSPIGSTLTLSGAAAEPVLAADAAGTHVFTPWALFALLVIVTSGLLFCIFLFKQRLVQSRLALLCSILLVGWYLLYTAFAYLIPQNTDAAFHPTPWAAFPCIAAVFSFLAFRAILKDEMLVRSLDRLR